MPRAYLAISELRLSRHNSIAMVVAHTKRGACGVGLKRCLVTTLFLLVWSQLAECLAQQPAVLNGSGTESLSTESLSTESLSTESLSEQVNDPTAILTQGQLQEFYTPSEYGTNAQPNTLHGRFVVAILPHGVLPLAQLVRPTFSLATIARSKRGSTRTEFGDLQLVDLFVMPRSLMGGADFRWAVGPYLVSRTATSRSAGRGTWQAGPAGAFRYRPISGLLISGLVQQATSFAYTSPDRTPVTRLTFQPLLSYQLGRGWYARSSDATWSFNVRHHTPTTMPLSAALGKVWELSAGVAINGAIAGEWMVYRQYAPRAEQFTLKFQVTLLFPAVEL
jgi:hypothetical protein